MILPLLSCVTEQLAVRTGTKNRYDHYLSLCANLFFSIVGIYFPSVFPRNRQLGVLIFPTFPFFSIDTSRTFLSLTSKSFNFLSSSSSSIPENPNFSLHSKINNNGEDSWWLLLLQAPILNSSCSASGAKEVLHAFIAGSSRQQLLLQVWGLILYPLCQFLHLCLDFWKVWTWDQLARNWVMFL